MVTGTKGDADYLSLTVYGGPSDGRYSERIVGSVNDRGLDIADDGTFSVVLSPDTHDGAWVKLEPDAVCAITRDYLADPDHGVRAEWHIEAVDPPATRREDDADLARRLRATLTWVRDQAQIVPIPLGTPNTVDEPYPVPTQTFGWAAGDAAYAMGSYALEEDEALVLEGTSPPCAFWNVCLWNQFLHTYDYDYEQVTINGSQVRYEPDGSWRLVVAPRDPGQPNWISTAGHRRGRIWFRWFLPESTPARPTARLVPSRRSHRFGIMSGRPAPVVLDDLAAPRFSPEVDALRAAGGGGAARARSIPPPCVPPPGSRPGSTTSAMPPSAPGSTCCATPWATRRGSARPASSPGTPSWSSSSRTGCWSRTCCSAIPRSTTWRSNGRSSSAGCPAPAPPISTT